MMQPGYSILLVLPLASREAVGCGYEYIEPEHLFNALLKFAELNEDELTALIREKAALARLLEEKEEVCKLLQELGLSIPDGTAALRRGLRKIMGHGGCKPDDEKKMIHRSDASRRLCKRAEDLAASAGASSWQGAHLVKAIVEKPQGALAKALNSIKGRPSKTSKSSPKPSEPVATPLLDRYGKNLAPVSTTLEEPADPAVKVVLEIITGEAGGSLLLIEKGGRPAIELIQEVIALAEADNRQRRFVRIDLARFTGASAKPSTLLAGLLEEAARGQVMLVLEGLAGLLETGEEDAGTATLEQFLQEKRVCCICVANETAYYDRFAQQPWRRLLQPVWLHPLPKLPW